jgi:RNA polymerase sigma factor (sigma-70 family)
MGEFDTRQTLLERIKDQHDEQSWEEFVHSYEKFIFSIIRKMNIDAFTCEDLTQKVLLKLWQSLPSFDYSKEKGGFRYWLFRVTRNVVLSHLEKHQRRQKKFSEDYVPQADVVGKKLHEAEIEAIVESEWQVHICNMAYERIRHSISEKADKAFQMYINEVSVEQIAEELGMQASSVYVYTKRVRDKLMEQVKLLRAELE